MKVKPPVLNPASDEPMSLSFPNPTNVRDIYKAIGQAFGINILFDNKMRDQKLSHRAEERHRPRGARVRDAGRRPLLQGARPQDRDRGRGHAAEPPRLRGPGRQDVLPLQRGREGHQQHAARPDRRAADRDQRAAQLDRDPRHRRQGGDRRAPDQRQRQGEGRGAGGRRAACRSTPTSCATSACRSRRRRSRPPFDATKLGGSSGHVGPLRSTQLGDITRSMWNMAVPIGRPQPDQVRRRDRDTRAAPAPHHRAGEGEPGHRPEGADPDDDVQHDADDRRQHRADHRVHTTRTWASSSTSSPRCTTTTRSR